MSNAYINQVIFGISKEQVDDEYVRELLPLMLTDERMKRFQTNIDQNTVIEPLVHRDSAKIIATVPEKKEIILDTTIRKPRFQQQNNSLFWAIYELEHPEEAFLGTKANAEVNHRLKVVASLKSTPKRLKETNSKLTIEQTQALLGSMLVAKEDKLDFCIAYAAYYNKPIIVVYEKTYRVFSHMVDVDLNDDIILLYASRPDSSKHTVFSAENTLTPDIVSGIMKTKVMGPLRSMSSYKTQELDNISAILNVPVKQMRSIHTKCDLGKMEMDENNRQKEKRRKKEDIYNDIKVAVHKDMNFISENAWNASNKDI